MAGEFGETRSSEEMREPTAGGGEGSEELEGAVAYEGEGEGEEGEGEGTCDYFGALASAAAVQLCDARMCGDEPLASVQFDHGRACGGRLQTRAATDGAVGLALNLRLFNPLPMPVDVPSLRAAVNLQSDSDPPSVEPVEMADNNLPLLHFVQDHEASFAWGGPYQYEGQLAVCELTAPLQLPARGWADLAVACEFRTGTRTGRLLSNMINEAAAVYTGAAPTRAHGVWRRGVERHRRGKG